MIEKFELKNLRLMTEYKYVFYEFKIYLLN